MHEQRELLLKKIGQVLASFPQIELGYVHGSFLHKPTFRDLDIAVKLSMPFSRPHEAFRFAMRLGGDVEKIVEPRCDVDVKILNGAPIAFQYEVVHTGRLVHVQSDMKRIRYVAAVLSEY